MIKKVKYSLFLRVLFLIFIWKFGINNFKRNNYFQNIIFRNSHIFLSDIFVTPSGVVRNLERPSLTQKLNYIINYSTKNINY